MKPFIFLFILLSLTWFSCKDDCPKPIVPHVIINDSALSVVWKVPFGYNGLASYAGIYSNMALFAVNENAVSFNDFLIALDKNTGKEIWRTSESFYLPNHYYQIENILYFESNGDVYAINLINGLIKWHVKSPYNLYVNGALSYVGGKLWYNWCSGNKYTGDSTILYSINPENGDLSKIHTWHNIANDYYQLSFYRVGLWMHPKGDSILILTSNSFNWNTNQSKPDLIAWNLNADTAYFDYRNYSKWEGLSDPMIIDNDLILYDGWQYAKSIKLITLKENWNLTLPDESKSNSQLFYHEGTIMTQLSTNRDAITWINPNTGKIIKTLLGTGSYFNGYYFKNNWLYFCGGTTIKKVDLNLNKILWEFESPEDDNGSRFNGEMALDVPNDLIYTTDYRHFYCFKINK